MYYCRRCRKYHSSGKIARSHTIYAKRVLKPIRKPARKPIHRPAPVLRKPLEAVLTVKKKKKPKTGVRHDEKKYLPARPSKLGYSKKRKAQLAVQITDPHE